MLENKLTMKTGEEGGYETAEDDSLEPSEHQRIPSAVSPSVYERLGESHGHHAHPSRIDKETVFEWFGLHLNPAKRIEFMCGLLHMCQPLELRFLGSYLEDLARKDYHVLRDSECRANSPSDIDILTDVTDPVVRSKLIVYLSLLGSDRRECAGILFRILSHVDPALLCKDYDYSLPPFREHRLYPPYQDGNMGGRSEETCGFSTNETAAGSLEQLALLFTMASLHPAFRFHQRETIRHQIDKIELVLEEERRQSRLKINAQELTCLKMDFLPSPELNLGERTAPRPPCQSQCNSHWVTPREAVHIERIMLRAICQTRTDKEYKFEVRWSGSSSSRVTKTHRELKNFLLKLPKDQCTEPFEKSVLRLLNQGDQYESGAVEMNLREMFLSAPLVFRQSRKVCSFFSCDSSYSAKPTCCPCNCQLGKTYQGDCSDASSQEEDLESYVQGHKKKHGTRSPCQCVSSAKASQGDSWAHGTELNGSADRKKKSCTLRSSQEAQQHQDTEKRSHPVTKIKSRVLPTDREKGKRKGAAFVTNGSLIPALSPLRKDGGSGPDTFGETSSESYSSPSSPQRPGLESPDSEDDNNKDIHNHSDDSSKGLRPDMCFPHQSDAAVAGNVSSVHSRSSNNQQTQMPALCPEISTEFSPPLSFMHPCRATDSPLPLGPPPSQSIIPEGKASTRTLMMQTPLVPSAVPSHGIMGDPEKREMLPTFGISPIGPHAPGSLVVQPLVTRFKTVQPHSQGGTDGASGNGSTPAVPQTSNHAPIRAIAVMTHGPTCFPSTLQQPLLCQDLASVSSCLASSLPQTSHAKHQSLSLPSGLPSPYTMASVGAPAGTGTAQSPGNVQAAVPLAVPTHTPGPAPSPSPALTHSTAHSDCTSYSNSSTFCGSAPVASGKPITPQQAQHQQVASQQPVSLQPPPQQQQQQQQQQQPARCGACGCDKKRGGSAAAPTVSATSPPVKQPYSSPPTR
uniref:Zinc finger, CCHC domain containing 2 n=1 Tax=Monopterus albus TaxID=43700 RepID=A0A3Q3J5E8_MONAL